jgi:NTE family protein
MSVQRPRIGVVIASGNIKAFSSIPLFQYLENEEIPVDMLIGCSGGSIVAAAYGSGMSAAEMRDKTDQFLNKRLFSHRDLRSLMGMYNLPFGRFNKTSGFFKPDRILDLYRSVFGSRDLADFPIRTMVQVTEYDTGLGKVLERGPAAEAVYASGAIFPILPPIEIDGTYYTDGFYTSSLPIMEAVKRHVDVIIALFFEDPIHPAPKSFFSCFNNIYKIQSAALTRYQTAMAIDLHDHEIIIIKVPFSRTIKMWETDTVPSIIEVGRKAVEAKKKEIVSAIESYSQKQN